MKLPIKLLIALLAVVVGLVGIIVCITPGRPAPDKTMEKYIAAINKADASKMQDCYATGALMQQLGDAFDIDMDDYLEENSQKLEVSVDYDRLAALQDSYLSVSSMLPENTVEVKKVKLLGCTNSSDQKADQLSAALLGTKLVEVLALVEVTYVTEDGEQQTVRNQESLGMVQTDSGYRLVDF